MATWNELQTQIKTLSDRSHAVRVAIDSASSELVAISALLAGIADLPSIDPPPQPLTVIIEGPTEVEVIKTITYQAHVSGGVPPYSYSWNTPSGQTQQVVYAWTDVGLKSVDVTVTDSRGVTIFGQLSVTVKPKPVEPPPVGLTVNVGPSAQFATPDVVPWASLQPRTTVNIAYRATPYPSKLVLNRGDITIHGMPGPNGERPVLTGVSAFENRDWVTSWTTQLVGKGLISIIKPDANSTVKNVRIEGLELRGARRVNQFTYKGGNLLNYLAGCAGVYAITCDGVEIVNCLITDNENGVFAVTNENWTGSNACRNIALRWNGIHSNGVAGSDRQHNTYIEADGATYEFNNYNAYLGAGAHLKDRSAGAVIRYNRFTDGIRQLDLVDPESGASIITASPNWGRTYHYGNIHKNTKQASVIHFGFDGMSLNTQRDLFSFFNTMTHTGAEKITWYKCNGAPSRVFSGNNILHYGGGLFAVLYTHETGQSGTYFQLQKNFMTDKKTYVTYDASWNPTTAVPVDGWSGQVFGADPGLDGNSTLKIDSVCRGKAVWPTGWPISAPAHGWSAASWVPRTIYTSIGAAE